MNNLPTGTVTFLFTDIEGSTKLSQEHPVEMLALLAGHHEILHQSIQTHNGDVFQIVGDSFAVAFHSASDAVNAALDEQRCLQMEKAIASCSSFAISRDGVIKSTSFEFFAENPSKDPHHRKDSSKIL